MNQNETVFSEQVLSDISQILATYSAQYREILNDTMRKTSANSGDWNDEDFNALLSALKSFEPEADAIEKMTRQFTERISAKLDAIHQLRNIKI